MLQNAKLRLEFENVEVMQWRPLKICNAKMQCKPYVVGWNYEMVRL